MLKAEVYALNENGHLNFDYDQLTLHFDDFYAEAGDLVEKLSPAPEHRNGEYMIYDLTFTRDKNSILQVCSFIEKA